jgi:predicted CopG family antitoxin
MAETTTISVKTETKRLLAEFGKKGDSYDQIIRRLVERASMKELDERWNRILKEDKFIPLEEL